MHTSARTRILSLATILIAAPALRAQNATRAPSATMQASVTILSTTSTVEFSAPGTSAATAVAQGSLRVRGSAACRLVMHRRIDAPANTTVRVAGRDGAWHALDTEGVIVGECTNGRGMEAAPVVEVDGRRVDLATAPVTLALEMDAGT